jgi:hypothetical protein
MDERPVTFPAARYRLDCVAQTPVHLREYAGSTLRGAFGHALKRTVCMTRQPDCKVCALYRSCIYPAVFAPPAPAAHRVQKFSDIPAPYVIEPMPWGEKHYAPGEDFSFHFVLMGRALAHLPILIHAWQRALAHGVGVGEGRARLVRVHHVTTDTRALIYDVHECRVIAHEAILPPPGPVPPRVTLLFQTQLRLQHEGKPLGPDTIRPERLLIGLLKRIALIAEFHIGQPLALDFADLAHRAKTLHDARRLAWRDWTRYSNRQKQEMQLGGVIGEWTLEGELAPFWPYLHLGQWLHVGKNATFGLGNYRLHA